MVDLARQEMGRPKGAYCAKYNSTELFMAGLFQVFVRLFVCLFSFSL